VVQKLAEIHAADGQVAFVDPVEGHDPPATLSGGPALARPFPDGRAYRRQR
jgi:hypothetical protein